MPTHLQRFNVLNNERLATSNHPDTFCLSGRIMDLTEGPPRQKLNLPQPADDNTIEIKKKQLLKQQSHGHLKKKAYRLMSVAAIAAAAVVTRTEGANGVTYAICSKGNRWTNERTPPKFTKTTGRDSVLRDKLI